jgi:hypothetical protein
VRAIHETHRLGVFATAAWKRLLAEAVFTPDAIEERTTGQRLPRTFFIGRRPAR